MRLKSWTFLHNTLTSTKLPLLKRKGKMHFKSWRLFIQQLGLTTTKLQDQTLLLKKRGKRCVSRVKDSLLGRLYVTTWLWCISRVENSLLSHLEMQEDHKWRVVSGSPPLTLCWFNWSSSTRASCNCQVLI